EVCREMARRWRKVVVLKGAYTVVASPEGQVRLSPFANPGLASAGTGDVLAGAVAGLLAQGVSSFDSASLGVYLHGMAGEIVRARLGEAGTLASDLLPALPEAITKLREGHNVP
ncbi:MAG: NAD(P)H-hydrate dehydratase, partial [Dehalococcoidia bacterium]|nr:NAD(P)H-hydrate dehydratase [Dehalococcoidia bacterium]